MPHFEFKSASDFMNSRVGKSYVLALQKALKVKNVKAHEVTLGVSEEAMKWEIGDSPALISYTQADFWGNGNHHRSHGIAYYKGHYHDPYIGRSGTFEQTRGSKSTAVASDYIRVLYFTWEKL